MSSNPLIIDTKNRMDKCLKSLQTELTKVRTGRASTSILDNVKVDYYGAPTPLAQVATLGVPEPRMITIAPWDPKIIPDIEKAIMKADLGLTPTNDGKLVRLPIPTLTEERRKDLVKMVKKTGEEAKVAVRHVRRDSMDVLKTQEKESTITKDDHKHLGEEVEKATQEFVAKVDQMIAAKEKELMEV
ncbi:MAG: ribosome recycling factor [Deltaproteobacteria bacterium]|nr:ribosome recycling factor [Deltaproteobacteria bacterium]